MSELVFSVPEKTVPPNKLFFPFYGADRFLPTDLNKLFRDIEVSPLADGGKARVGDIFDTTMLRAPLNFKGIPGRVEAYVNFEDRFLLEPHDAEDDYLVHTPFGKVRFLTYRVEDEIGVEEVPLNIRIGFNPGCIEDVDILNRSAAILVCGGESYTFSDWAWLDSAGDTLSPDKIAFENGIYLFTDCLFDKNNNGCSVLIPEELSLLTNHVGLILIEGGSDGGFGPVPPDPKLVLAH